MISRVILRRRVVQLVFRDKFHFSPRLLAPIALQRRQFSNNEDLKETLRKVKEQAELKKEENAVNDDPNAPSSNNSDKGQPKHTNQDGPSLITRLIEYIGASYRFIIDNARLGWQEMMSEDKPSMLKKKLTDMAETKQQNKKPKLDENGNEIVDEDAAEEEVVAGPSAIVLVKEGKSPWEQMRERLADSPIIKEILKQSRNVGKVAASTDLGKAAQNVGQTVKDKIEDARNFWETSQNPLVYTVAGAWENLTGDTEEGIAIAAICKLDKDFNKEEWAAEVKEKLAPRIIKAHLEGDLKTLKPWLGEAVYSKLAADIRTRKNDKIVFDSNILNIDENQVIMRYLDDNGPVIVCIYMVQQINCIRKNGEIIEGSETDIRAKFYSLAFRQHFDEETASLEWKIVDYEFAGEIPYF